MKCDNSLLRPSPESDAVSGITLHSNCWQYKFIFAIKFLQESLYVCLCLLKNLEYAGVSRIFMVTYVKAYKTYPSCSHSRCPISLLKSIYIINILILIHVMIIMAFHVKNQELLSNTRKPEEYMVFNCIFHPNFFSGFFLPLNCNRCTSFCIAYMSGSVGPFF